LVKRIVSCLAHSDGPRKYSKRNPNEFYEVSVFHISLCTDNASLSLPTKVALEAAAAKARSEKRIKTPDFFKWFPSMKHFLENSAHVFEDRFSLW